MNTFLCLLPHRSPIGLLHLVMRVWFDDVSSIFFDWNSTDWNSLTETPLTVTKISKLFDNSTGSSLPSEFFSSLQQFLILSEVYPITSLILHWLMENPEEGNLIYFRNRRFHSIITLQLCHGRVLPFLNKSAITNSHQLHHQPYSCTHLWQLIRRRNGTHYFLLGRWSCRRFGARKFLKLISSGFKEGLQTHQVKTAREWLATTHCRAMVDALNVATKRDWGLLEAEFKVRWRRSVIVPMVEQRRSGDELPGLKLGLEKTQSRFWLHWAHQTIARQLS